MLPPVLRDTTSWRKMAAQIHGDDFNIIFSTSLWFIWLNIHRCRLPKRFLLLSIILFCEITQWPSLSRIFLPIGHIYTPSKTKWRPENFDDVIIWWDFVGASPIYDANSVSSLVAVALVTVKLQWFLLELFICKMSKFGPGCLRSCFYGYDISGSNRYSSKTFTS